MKPEIRWPLFIVGLLVAQVLLGMFFLYRATSDPSFAVEEDYYQKAIAWDDKLAQDRVNAELGWRVETSLQSVPRTGDSAELAVKVFDRGGAPVAGATVSVETFHNVRAGNILRGTLGETSPGVYVIALPMRRPGIWEVRLTVNHNGATFTSRQRSMMVAGAP
jgi:nitrogen fixation protein FixH